MDFVNCMKYFNAKSTSHYVYNWILSNVLMQQEDTSKPSS